MSFIKKKRNRLFFFSTWRKETSDFRLNHDRSSSFSLQSSCVALSTVEKKGNRPHPFSHTRQNTPCDPTGIQTTPTPIHHPTTPALHFRVRLSELHGSGMHRVSTETSHPVSTQRRKTIPFVSERTTQSRFFPVLFSLSERWCLPGQ